MKRRQSKPALLELFKTEQGDAVNTGADRSGASAWEPGRSMRVTAGHLLVALTVVMVLVVVTWMIAFRQGELQARAELESVIFQPVVEDPVLDASPAPQPVEVVAGPSSGPDDALLGDPRQAGLFYFVLAETRLEGALRLARFCRELGLETWVIPRDNAGLARVIALPGVVTTSRSEEACRVLDERIGAIGLRWKDSGGTSSLEDRYLVRWDG
ncbi:MAG: hypothetical protein CMJ40_11910 [Phycisphaerae bacterium]|nr:hypothetical protein [Phycisphaerae bacterium]|tara:strand:- start:2836 stop:3474 length:639 start_codon:yes stop_codon:yes gene_type:complete